MLSSLQKQMEEQQTEMGQLREAAALDNDAVTHLFKQVDILRKS